MVEPWTLLVYIATDVQLYDDAVANLLQITEASRFSSLRILVQLDGPGDNYAIRYQCSDGKRRVVWESGGNSNPDPSVRLEDFLNSAITGEFVEQRVFLILWGHGDGLDHVYLYGNRKTSMEAVAPSAAGSSGGDPEAVAAATPTGPAAETAIFIRNDAEANLNVGDMKLGAILKRFTSRIGRKIDLLGLDACMMGLAEVCHELAPSVSTLVASDEVSPSQSWPYDLIVRDIGSFPAVDARALSIIVVSRFLEKYSARRGKNRVSLTAYSLNDWSSLTTGIRRLVDVLTAQATNDHFHSRILRARDFATTGNGEGSVDFSRFCSEVVESFDEGSAVVTHAQTVLKLIVRTPYVVYHRRGGESIEPGFYGLGIFFPDVLPPTITQIEQGFHLSEATSTSLKPAPSPDYDGAKFGTFANTKTVTVENTKTVVIEHTKNVDGGLANGGISGSEVPWDCYCQLEFNRATGWADFLETILASSTSSVVRPALSA